MKQFKVIVGVTFIVIGILFFIFLRELNDPEIEGDSGRIGIGSYIGSVALIIIGIIILLLPKNNSK